MNKTSLQLTLRCGRWQWLSVRRPPLEATPKLVVPIAVKPSAR